MALCVSIGIWGTLYGIFVHIMYLFAITACFLSFPDKNCWFSSQRRREGFVGDANGSISKNNVLYLFPLFFLKIVNYYLHKFKINWH